MLINVNNLIALLKLLALARVMARVQLAVRDDRMTDTNLSAEGVFEVEVEERCGSLGADSGLDVELVSLQNVVNILGLPVDDCPANKWIYLAACCHVDRLGGVLPNDNALHRMEVGPGATFLQTVRGCQESAQPHTSSHQSLTTQPAPALATLSSKLILLLSLCWRLCAV